jgi:glycosyltransferase involved in cell wall biosynthesis
MPPQEANAHLGRLGISGAQPFLFHIGGNQWYKNRLGVLHIFSCLLKRNPARDLKLVMAGKPWTQVMCRFVCDNGLELNIVRLTEVSNEELRALYSSAIALLFPSLQEGFGWPIVEAQACGCPVFTSNRAPMNDVGGNAAIYIDPEDAAGAAIIVAENLHSVSDLRPASMKNAARFSTSAMISGYLRLYESLLNENSPRHQLR